MFWPTVFCSAYQNKWMITAQHMWTKRGVQKTSRASQVPGDVWYENGVFLLLNVVLTEQKRQI